MFEDYLCSEKGKMEAAEAVRTADTLRDTSSSEIRTSIGLGWFVQARDGDWTKLQYGPNNQTVYYRREHGSALVSDRGLGIQSLRRAFGDAEVEAKLSRINEKVSKRDSNFQVDGDAICARVPIDEMLGEFICSALRMTDYVSSMQISP